jgi:hypothetical protein
MTLHREVGRLVCSAQFSVFGRVMAESDERAAMTSDSSFLLFQQNRIVFIG